MRVLVACEFSGVVRDAFAVRGHEAWSCDLLPSETPGNHYQGELQHFLTRRSTPIFDLMIAHPPCTHLAVSGARWFKDKLKEQAEALEFVSWLMEGTFVNIPRICVENPVSIISSRIRQPDQVIQPHFFGDKAFKATCLWLKGLPPSSAHTGYRCQRKARQSIVSGALSIAWLRARIASASVPGRSKGLQTRWPTSGAQAILRRTSRSRSILRKRRRFLENSRIRHDD